MSLSIEIRIHSDKPFPITHKLKGICTISPQALATNYVTANICLINVGRIRSPK